MGVSGGVPGGPGKGLLLAPRDMVPIPRVSKPFGQTKVNDVNGVLIP